MARVARLDQVPGAEERLRRLIDGKIRRRQRGLSQQPWSAIRREMSRHGVDVSLRQLRRLVEERWPDLWDEAGRP